MLVIGGLEAWKHRDFLGEEVSRMFGPSPLVEPNLFSMQGACSMKIHTEPIPSTSHMWWLPSSGPCIAQGTATRCFANLPVVLPGSRRDALSERRTESCCCEMGGWRAFGETKVDGHKMTQSKKLLTVGPRVYYKVYKVKWFDYQISSGTSVCLQLLPIFPFAGRLSTWSLPEIVKIPWQMQTSKTRSNEGTRHWRMLSWYLRPLLLSSSYAQGAMFQTRTHIKRAW